MNFTIIKKQPGNINDYVKVPPNNIREEYIRSLVVLLRQRTFNIQTDEIEIEWAETAAQEAPASGFRIMMQQVPVNFGEPGTAFGTFYFELHPSN